MNGSSPSGFIYFNPKFLNRSNCDQSRSQNQQKNPSDTQDFLAFDNSPVQNISPRTHHSFSPSNFSSPNKYSQRHPSPYNYNSKSPRGRGLHHNYSYSGHSFYSPNRFETTPNSSKNFGYNQNNRTWHKRKSHSGNDQTSTFQKGSTSLFYDHTCLDNPWLDLEKQLEEQIYEETEKSLKIDNSQQSSQDSEDTEENSSDGESSSENDTQS